MLFRSEFDSDFFASVTVEATVDCHDVLGGTARGRVCDAISATRVRVQILVQRYGSVSLGDSTEQEAMHAGA